MSNQKQMMQILFFLLYNWVSGKPDLSIWFGNKILELFCFMESIPYDKTIVDVLIH